MLRVPLRIYRYFRICLFFVSARFPKFTSRSSWLYQLFNPSAPWRCILISYGIHDAVIREFDILTSNLGKLGHDTSRRDELGDLNRTQTTGNASETWPATSYCSKGWTHEPGIDITGESARAGSFTCYPSHEKWFFLSHPAPYSRIWHFSKRKTAVQADLSICSLRQSALAKVAVISWYCCGYQNPQRKSSSSCNASRKTPVLKPSVEWQTLSTAL